MKRRRKQMDEKWKLEEKQIAVLYSSDSFYYGGNREHYRLHLLYTTIGCQADRRSASQSST